MAKHPSVDEAVERAKRAQDNRIDAVRTLAQAREALTATHEQGEREIAALRATLAEQDAAARQVDRQAYSRALAAGWTTAELVRIGFTASPKPPPAKPARTRVRGAGKAPSSTADQPNATNAADQTATT